MKKFSILLLAMCAGFFAISCDGGDTTTPPDDTVVSATINTLDASEITSTSATLSGSISKVGTPAYSECGFCYATTENPTSNKTSVSKTGTGIFEKAIDGLTPETTYYVRAYAVNGTETVYGSQVSFKTQKDGKALPTVTTISAADIAGKTATLGGDVTDEGFPVFTEHGICWSTSQNPTITTGTKVVIDGSGAGEFDGVVEGFTPKTKYYVRAYATNAEGTAYGDQIEFTTTDQYFSSIEWNNEIKTKYPAMLTDGQLDLAKMQAYVFGPDDEFEISSSISGKVPELGDLRTLLPNITILSCTNRGIGGVFDVSGMTKLVTVYCYGNNFTDIITTGCTSLVTMACRNNQDITALTFKDLPAFKTLNLSNGSQVMNNLVSVTITNCPEFGALDGRNCIAFTGIDLGACKKVTTVNCSGATVFASLKMNNAVKTTATITLTDTAMAAENIVWVD